MRQRALFLCAHFYIYFVLSIVQYKMQNHRRRSLQFDWSIWHAAGMYFLVYTAEFLVEYVLLLLFSWILSGLPFFVFLILIFFLVAVAEEYPHPRTKITHIICVSHRAIMFRAYNISVFFPLLFVSTFLFICTRYLNSYHFFFTTAWYLAISFHIWKYFGSLFLFRSVAIKLLLKEYLFSFFTLHLFFRRILKFDRRNLITCLLECAV